MKRIFYILFYFLSIGCDAQVKGVFNAIDPTVTDYETRLAVVGGTITSTQRSAVTNLVRGIASKIGSKVIDYGVFLGQDATDALVKVKYIDATYKEFALTGTITYSSLTGLTKASVGTGKLSHQFDPISNGLSYQNFSAGYFMVDNVTPANSQTNMSTNPVSANPGFYLQSSALNLNATGFPTVANPVIKQGDPTFVWISNTTTGINWGFNYTSMYKQPPASIPASFELSAISVLGGRAGGSETTSGRGSVVFSFVGEYFTYTELMGIQDEVRKFLKAIGRLSSTQQDIVLFGDSITKGVGTTNYNDRFSYVLAGYFGLREINCGITSSAFRVSTNTINGGYDRRAEILKHAVLSGGKVSIHYGVNDMTISDVTTNGDATLISDFTTKLSTTVSELIAAGVPAGNIYVNTPSYVNTSTANLTKQAAWAVPALTVAQTYHTKYTDVFGYMRDNGAATLLFDTVHPNTAGHLAIATCVYNLSIQY